MAPSRSGGTSVTFYLAVGRYRETTSALVYNGRMTENPNRTAVGGMIGALVGGFAGLEIVGYIACSVLYPDSNQCGLLAFFIGLPAGATIGWAMGTLISRMIGRR
jgi:hypothetical protein